MFEQAMLRLLEGVFICETSAPSIFRWLRAPENRNEIGDYLAKVGRKLTETPNGHAFYATWYKVRQDDRPEAKRVMTTIKQTIRPLVQFLTLCMDASKSNSAPSPGDRLDYPQLLVSIMDKPHLQERLREFASFGKEFGVNEATPKAMLEKLIQQMEKQGYLVIFNKDQEAWRFTGKLDYYYQMIDFLMENESGIATEGQADVDETEGSTGRLL